MKFVTMIPLNRNDGSAIHETEIQEVLEEIIETFGGLTIEGTVDGSWIEGGQTFKDKNLKISVACENSRYEEAKKLVIEIGRRFDQLAMFFEVCYFDGVQILEVN